MLIKRVSPVSGLTHEREIEVTEEQVKNWRAGVLIQNAMPNLSPSDREFILTGMIDEEWDEIFEGHDDE